MNTPTLLNELRPRACFRFRALPVFGPMLDDLLKWFQDQGYTTSTIHNHIQGIDELVRLLKRRPEGLICLKKAQLDAAYDHFHHRKPGVAGTVRAIGRFLCERKLLAEEPRKAVPHSERELELFGAYLRDVRGLAEGPSKDTRTAFFRFFVS